MRSRFTLIALVLGWGVTASPVAACIGDCDENGTVDVADIVTGIGMVLGTASANACPSLYGLDGRVDVADLLVAVGHAVEGCPSRVELDRLATARARWQAAGIDSYVMRYARHCFCPGPGPVDIVVRGGRIESITSVATGQPVESSADGIWGYLPVDELFVAIDQAIRSADVATVRYDDELGYPVDASFDFIRGAVDDELGIAIESLQPQR